MGDYDSSPMLYCSRVFSHKKFHLLQGGWATVACLLMAGKQLFYRFIKKQHQQQNGRMTAVLYCYSLVG